MKRILCFIRGHVYYQRLWFGRPSGWFVCLVCNKETGKDILP